MGKQQNLKMAERGPEKGSGDKAAGGEYEKKKKETILDLSKYLDKSIRVKFSGGREAAGVLKGYDPLLNLGLVVCRGTSVVLICPSDGMEAIANPFIAQDG